MRKLARILTGITIVVLVFMLIILMGPHLRVTLGEVSSAPATEQPEVFETIASAVERGDLGSDQYRAMDSRNPSDYRLVTYTCSLYNAGLMPAGWIRLQLSPAEEDVALLCGEPADLTAFGRGTVQCVLLTRAEDTTRNLWADYYLFGRPRSAVAEEG